jgi:hypothetical protein
MENLLKTDKKREALLDVSVSTQYRASSRGKQIDLPPERGNDEDAKD